MGAAAAGSPHADPISLAVGEPAEAPPLEVVEAGRRAIVEGRTRYDSAGGLAALRRGLAAEHEARTGVATAPEQVVVSAGGKAALIDALRCLLEPGDEVLVLAPYWPTYLDQVRWCGAVPVVVPSAAGAVDIGGLEAAATPRSRVLVLNTPNNPSGGVLSPDEMARVAAFAEARDLWVVSDEVYRGLQYTGPAGGAVAAVPDLAERTVTIESFSKRFAMTGYRVGAAVAPLPLARALLALSEAATTHPATASQHAAVAALARDGGGEAEQRARYQARTARVAAALDAVDGITCAAPPATFYAWPEVGGWLARHGVPHVEDLGRSLREEQGRRVVSGEVFGAPTHLRISCGLDDPRLDEALERLTAHLDR